MRMLEWEKRRFGQRKQGDNFSERQTLKKCILDKKIEYSLNLRPKHIWEC